MTAKMQSEVLSSTPGVLERAADTLESVALPSLQLLHTLSVHFRCGNHEQDIRDVKDLIKKLRALRAQEEARIHNLLTEFKNGRR